MILIFISWHTFKNIIVFNLSLPSYFLNDNKYFFIISKLIICLSSSICLELQNTKVSL